MAASRSSVFSFCSSVVMNIFLIAAEVSHDSGNTTGAPWPLRVGSKQMADDDAAPAAAEAAAGAGAASRGATGDLTDAAFAAVGISSADAATAARVLEALCSADEAALKAKALKQLRGGALRLAARMRLYDGQSPHEFSEARQERRAAKRRDQRDRALDREHVDKACALRASRLQRLEALQAQGAGMATMAIAGAEQGGVGGAGASNALPLVPDGVAPGTGVAAETLLLREGNADGMLAAAAAAAAGAGGAANGTGEAVEDEAPQRVKLSAPRACYTCKRRFRELHEFYDRLCPACAELNWAKRHATADLRGRVALVTGGRVKIGFRIALRLLRCGAQVVVTTRFPADCAARFAEQPDFARWGPQLQVLGLDLRDLRRVQRFAEELSRAVPHLDILINNACQTVRRPPAYYRHLMGLEATAGEWLGHGAQRVLEVEQGSWKGGAAAAEAGAAEAGAAGGGASIEGAAAGGGAAGGGGAVAGADAAGGPEAGAVATAAGGGYVDALHSAALSQLPVLASDNDASAEHFPEGAYDVNGQQVDLRTNNSWKMRLHEVDVGELLEVLAVNAAAPFALNSLLKPLLLRSPHPYRFVVNVSAMEGKFYRNKTPNHPHTNMAKAALNMMTKTSSADYAQDGIWMTSVDTGWINDENPLPDAARIAKQNNFQTVRPSFERIADVLGARCDARFALTHAFITTIANRRGGRCRARARPGAGGGSPHAAGQGAAIARGLYKGLQGLGVVDSLPRTP